MNLQEIKNNKKSEKNIKKPDTNKVVKECPKKEKDCDQCTLLNCPEEKT
jgi:hypothetical protein